MQLKSILIICVVCSFLVSCNNNIDDKAIYKKVINARVFPTPSPPPPPNSESSIKKEVIDSILNVPLKIAVDKYKLDLN